MYEAWSSRTSNMTTTDLTTPNPITTGPDLTKTDPDPTTTDQDPSTTDSLFHNWVRHAKCTLSTSILIQPTQLSNLNFGKYWF